jgi:hypothetical protein
MLFFLDALSLGRRRGATIALQKAERGMEISDILSQKKVQNSTISRKSDGDTF